MGVWWGSWSDVGHLERQYIQHSIVYVCACIIWSMQKGNLHVYGWTVLVKYHSRKYGRELYLADCTKIEIGGF